MALDSHDCPNCGASVKTGTLQCEYCGTWFNKAGRAKPRKPKSIDKVYAMLRLPIGVGEFGIVSQHLTSVGIVIALGLYVMGWFLENTQYWLDETAMTVWVGVLPLWLLGAAFVWRSNRTVLVGGFLVALVEFIAHNIIILVIRGRLWDDHIGIAGIVASTSLVGWLLGRLLHSIVRWRRVQSK